MSKPKFPKIYLGGGQRQKVQGSRHKGGAYPYLMNNVIDYNIYNLKIYVNSDNFFISPMPVISAGNRTNVADEWRKTEPYYKFILAVYVSTYCCGIGAEHLKFSEDVYPVITSIMRFHLYFMARRILERLKHESTESILREFKIGPHNDVIGNMSNIPRWDRTILVPRTGYGHGFYHETMPLLTKDYKTHYKRFIPSKTNGLTKIGTQYLNESIEAYVYAVLGSQAKTRVSIVNKGGGSLETQEEFRTLVNDAIVNYSVSTWILNMNKAITDTNVIQNLAISPNTWLVPGSMIILKERIAGYNNLLKRASEDMKFGINHSVNFTEIKKKVVKKIVTHKPKKLHQDEQSIEKEKEKEKKPVLDSLDEHVTNTPKPLVDKPIIYKRKPKSGNLITLSIISAALGFFISKYVF